MTDKRKPSWVWALGLPASLIALWLLLQIPIEIGAAKVYDEKKPEMIGVVDQKIQTHELKVEPRLQAIEQSTSESVTVQKAILEELKKGNE